MTGIKISELSIGDWVVLENQPFKVIGINPPYIDLLGNGNRLRLSDIDNDNLSPIRLTPEILEKNGFVRQDTESEIRYTLIEGNTMFGGTWAKSVFQWTFPMDFRFVHQLQHALRLAGVEKEIEL